MSALMWASFELEIIKHLPISGGSYLKHLIIFLPDLDDHVTIRDISV